MITIEVTVQSDSNGIETKLRWKKEGQITTGELSLANALRLWIPMLVKEYAKDLGAVSFSMPPNPEKQ